MDETPSNEKPAKDFNKIDLGQLQGFSFGTQWTQDKAEPSGRSGGGMRDQRRDDRPRGDGPGGDVKRDRRGFRKPAGSGEGSAPFAPAPTPASHLSRDDQDSRAPRRDGPPRGDFRGPGGPRRDGGPRFGGQGQGFQGGGRDGQFGERDRGPYISPFFNVTFYPEDTGFAALAKAIRASCRTYELFEIARVIIGKNDRFVAVIQRRPPEGAPAEGAIVKPAPLAIAVPDGTPFENENAAIAYVLEKHLGQFFDTAEVEVEAPKGNYQVINRCTVTGELLGPPNFHRYNQIVQQHHAANIRLPFEVYRSKIETIRDPEVVAQWLQKMKKVVRYTWKLVAEGETAPTFDSLEEARTYLLTSARDKVVRTSEMVRYHGKNVDAMPPGELQQSILGALERQRRFPLDTANALRGRLRREGFTIFKKGSKGISYVCAVKRKFRVPGQTFSDSIGALIGFIEANPMTKASDLPAKLLGITVPPKTTEPAAPAPVADAAAAGEGAPAAPAAPAATLSAEDQARLSRLNGDLRWLVTEGYVTEFIDGRLFAAPAMVESRKKEIEGAEHDPENFPEIPPAESSAVKPAPADASPAVESPTPASATADESPKTAEPAN